MKVSDFLRQAAQSCANSGLEGGGGGYHILDVAHRSGFYGVCREAASLYASLFDPSTPNHTCYFWFDSGHQIVMALLFAAEVAESQGK